MFKLPKWEPDKVGQHLNWGLRVVEIIALGALVLTYVDLRRKVDELGSDLSRRADVIQPLVEDNLRKLAQTQATANQTLQTTNEALTSIKQDLHDNLEQSKESLKNTNTLSASAQDMLKKLDLNMFGGVAVDGTQVQGTVPAITVDVVALGDVLKEAKTDLHSSTEDVHNTLLPLATAITNIGDLTKKVDEQITAGSPEVKSTLDSLKKTLDSTSALLQNEDIQKALGNLDTTSANVAGITGEVQEILKPWMEHPSLLKKLLPIIIGILKVDVTTLIQMLR